MMGLTLLKRKKMTFSEKSIHNSETSYLATIWNMETFSVMKMKGTFFFRGKNDGSATF